MSKRAEDRPRSGRPRTARTKKVIKAVRERVKRNPKRSARQMAKDMNVSVASMRAILKNDLQLSPYKMRKRQYPHLLKSTKVLNEQTFFLEN